MLVDQFGRSLEHSPLTKIAPLLRADKNEFEGIVNMRMYDDAIDAKTNCAHCHGPIEGVLRFPKDYLKAGPDSEERIADAKRQMIKKLIKTHYCVARKDADKLPVADWLRRFE